MASLGTESDCGKSLMPVVAFAIEEFSATVAAKTDPPVGKGPPNNPVTL